MALSDYKDTNHFSDSSVNETYMRFEWSGSQSKSGNYTTISWSIKACRPTTSNYVYFHNINWDIGGNTGSKGSTSYSNGETIASDSFTVYHNPAGQASFSFSMAANVFYSGGGYIYASDSWTLDTIPRYANITSFSVSKRDLTSVKFNWTADASCDYAWYSTNNGASWNALPNSNIVSGLSYNTGYNFKLRVRRTDSQLTTDSSTYYQTTYDIAKISSAPNINLGDNELVEYSNPSGSTIKLSIQNTAGTLFYCNDRVVSDSSYMFNFTDQELDTLYKAMGTSNSLNARIYLKTFYSQSGYYTDYKQITITLTGNQKTGHINVNDVWKRSKKWLNVNGVWKRCVRWVNVNGTWKRCI